MAATPGVEVLSAFCESHAARSPSMRWGGCCARYLVSTSWKGGPPGTECANRCPTPTTRIWSLDDLLGIADPMRRFPAIDPGCAAAAIDRAGERDVVARTDRRCTSSRMRTGSMRSASR